MGLSIGKLTNGQCQVWPYEKPPQRNNLMGRNGVAS